MKKILTIALFVFNAALLGVVGGPILSIKPISPQRIVHYLPKEDEDIKYWTSEQNEA